MEGVSAEKNADTAAVDGDLTEDEKIEKFFALIRSCKELREHLRIAPEQAIKDENDAEKRRKRKRSPETTERNASSWIPAFKWEDFTENYSRIQLRNSLIEGGDRARRRDNRPPPETDGGGLDLSLRL